MDELRQELLTGRRAIARVGAVRPGSTASLPFVVVDAAGVEIAAVSAFLRELLLSDMSPLTARSYANDLLRWSRLLWQLNVSWDRATRAEVEILVGWMRTADNPQRRRATDGSVRAVAVNLRTGKQRLRLGYAPATINHQLAVLAGFYDFHATFSEGPATNPVPASAQRRARLAHRSPMEPQAEHRRAPLRQRKPQLTPRAIPDALVEELLAVLRSHRDRALISLFLSTGARASELLGVLGGQVDWTRQQVWVVSKGTRAIQPVPASPEALRHLALYFDQRGTPAPDEPIWRTEHGPARPLTYSAARRILQRANQTVGTDWSLHDLRHTTIERLTGDETLTMPEIMAITRHAKVASLQPYLRPRVEQVIDKLQRHQNQPRPAPTPAPGYDAEDFRTVFGD